MLDCVDTRGKTTQIGFSTTYLWKVPMTGSTCTVKHKIFMLKLPTAKHDDWKQKGEEMKIRRLNQVESNHSQVKKISKLRI